MYDHYNWTKKESLGGNITILCAATTKVRLSPCDIFLLVSFQKVIDWGDTYYPECKSLLVDELKCQII